MTARLIMKMKVASVAHEANGIAVYGLRHPWRDRLAEPQPGAHVDVKIPAGISKVRATRNLALLRGRRPEPLQC